MTRSARLLAMTAVLGSITVGCTTTYTEEDLRAEEAKEDAEARAEETHSGENIEEGGENEAAIEEEKKWVGREGDL